MRFVLEVDVSEMAPDAVSAELGRILRYWAGGLKQMELKPGVGSDIYDSEYRQVGRWELTDPADTSTGQ